MAYEIVMPQLGLSMDSGKIVKWLKQPGENVQAGEILLEVESDKAVVEVEAVNSGILHISLGPQDGEILIGQVIGYLLLKGEQLPVENLPKPINDVDTDSHLRQSDVSPNINSDTLHPYTKEQKGLFSSPRARYHARKLGIDWRMAIGTGPRGRIKERDILRLANELQITAPPTYEQAGFQEEKLNITPVAKRLAEALGLDIIELVRDSPGKRIGRADVEQAVREVILRAKQKPNLTTGETITQMRREKMSSVRRTIAQRMVHSVHTTAPVTLTTEVDSTEVVKIRENLKNTSTTGVSPSYNAILAIIVSRALCEHPIVNATLEGEDIVYRESVNIGIAVDTERGLVVPVIRNVHSKNIWEVSREVESLLSRASKGKALPDELHGSTFTITNLGMYDIDTFTPIINCPECAILGVGRLLQKMVIFNNRPLIRTMLQLSLTFDHRIVDGAPAARFLQLVKHLIENPYLWWQALNS